MKRRNTPTQSTKTPEKKIRLTGDAFPAYDYCEKVSELSNESTKVNSGGFCQQRKNRMHFSPSRPGSNNLNNRDHYVKTTERVIV